MPIPETPITRAEQYLNAIATSDTSNIPATPMTREEMYLDYIARNAGGGGGSSTLSGMTDVDISNPSDGQTLVYNGTTRKWENVSRRTLRIGEVYDEATDTSTITETWQTIYDAIVAGLLVFITSDYDDPGYLRAAITNLVKSAYYEYHTGTYKVTVDGLLGGQLATYEYEAASANDYPVAL